MRQLTLATASFERYVRLTRRGAFLAEMERVYRGATSDQSRCVPEAWQRPPADWSPIATQDVVGEGAQPGEDAEPDDCCY